jgi:hypothetical protein
VEEVVRINAAARNRALGLVLLSIGIAGLIAPRPSPRSQAFSNAGLSESGFSGLSRDPQENL